MGKSIFAELCGTTEMEEGLKIILSRLYQEEGIHVSRLRLEEESHATGMKSTHEAEESVQKRRTNFNVAAILDSNGITDEEAYRFLELMRKVVHEDDVISSSIDEMDILHAPGLSGNETAEALDIVGRSRKGLPIPTRRSVRMQREDTDWIFNLAEAMRIGALNLSEKKELLRIVKRYEVKPESWDKVPVGGVLFSFSTSEEDAERFVELMEKVEWFLKEYSRKIAGLRQKKGLLGEENEK